MTAGTVVGVGADAAGTGNTTVVLPAHQADDVIVLYLETQQSGGLAAPTTGGISWAHISGSPRAQGSNVTSLNVIWVRATSSGTPNPVVQIGATDHIVGHAEVYRGVSDPLDFVQGSGNASGANMSATGGTTTVPDCLVVVASANQTDTGTDNYAAITNGTLSGFTVQNQSFTALGNGGGVMVATGTRATPGATGTTTATVSVAGATANLVFGLAPGPSTTPVSTTISTTWNTDATVTSTRATTWRVLASVVAARATTWRALARTVATRAATWDVLRAVAATRAASWRVLKAVSSARSTTWNVASGLVSVSTTKVASWRVLASTSRTRATTWRVRQRVTVQRSTTWDTLATATISRSTTWRTRGRVTATRAALWRVLGRVIGTRSTSWNVQRDTSGEQDVDVSASLLPHRLTVELVDVQPVSVWLAPPTLTVEVCMSRITRGSSLYVRATVRLTGTRLDDVPPDLEMVGTGIALVGDVDTEPDTWTWLDAVWDGDQWEDTDPLTGVVRKYRNLRTDQTVEFVAPAYSEGSYFVYADVPTDPETTIVRAGIITLER